MGGENNTVHILSNTGVETLPEMSKDKVARVLIDRFAALLTSKA
jgi:phosphopantothenoylcysteine decarboxylase/phosphopantothenate--cysteine ligase